MVSPHTLNFAIEYVPGPELCLWKRGETHKEPHVKLHAQDDMKNEVLLNPFWKVANDARGATMLYAI